MLSYEKSSVKTIFQESVFGILATHEYELYLGNRDIGVMEMAMDNSHVFIFNVYLEPEYRGEGLFTRWLQSLGRTIVAFQPVLEAEKYWERVADEVYP